MLVIRTLTSDGTRTFSFENIAALDVAKMFLKRTTCKGFAGDLLTVDSNHGKIFCVWDNSTKGKNTLVWVKRRKQTVTYKAYGFEDECLYACEKLKSSVKRASVFRISGDLYALVCVK